MTGRMSSALARRLAQPFEAGIDQLESALRACPDDCWERSMWVVNKTDPWMWARDGEAHGRTEEAIQVWSRFWAVASHWLFFLDFYCWDGVTGTWAAPGRMSAVQDAGIDQHGAAVLPELVYTRDELIGYAAYGRQRVRDCLASLTAEQSGRRLPDWHPHRGKTFGQLVEVNLAHVQGHGGDMARFLRTVPAAPTT
jgi:hypothetical protein